MPRKTAVETQDQKPASPKKPGHTLGCRHLTAREIALACQLLDQGQSQKQISEVLRVSESAVSRCLAVFGDTRDIARKRLEAGALKMVRTVVNTTDANVALKALGKLDVVREEQHSGGNILIAIGQPGSALSPPQLTITGETPSDH